MALLGFMAVYVALLLYSPHLYPLDDHAFLRTIQIGRNLPFYLVPDIGRFYPLTAQEYNLLSRISPSPALYFAFNAVQFVVVGWLLIRLMGDGGDRARRLGVWLFVLLALSPGFVSAWFRFQVSERGALFFFVLFLFCYRAVLRERGAGWTVGALAMANLALYYKEPGFLMLGVFAALRLVSHWRRRPRATAVLDAALLLSCAVFVVAYVALVYVHKHGADYADFHKTGFREVFVRYAVNDPLLVLGAAPLALARLVGIGWRRREWDPVDDPGLFAAMIYVAFYLSLRIFSPWYLLPAYGFALPPMARFVTMAIARLRWAMVVPVSVQLVAALPLGLHLIAYHKDLPEAFATTVNYLTAELTRTPPGPRPAIFLVGVGRGGGVEIYVSLAENLAFRGLRPEQFDLKSDLPVDNVQIFDHLRSSLASYSAYRDEAPDRPRKGDYLVLTPWAALPDGRRAALSERFERVFRSEGTLVLPDFSLTRALTALGRGGVRAFWRMLGPQASTGAEFVVYSVQCEQTPLTTPPVALSDFQQTLMLRRHPVRKELQAGQSIDLELWVNNSGTQPWPVAEALTAGSWVRLSYHWIDEAGTEVEGPRQVLPCALRPGEWAATTLDATAPRVPGRHRLRISLVQEGVAWFDQRGGRPLELQFDVVR
jgi:hypothetical protein